MCPDLHEAVAKIFSDRGAFQLEEETADIEVSTKDTLTLLNEYIDEVEMSVDKSDLKGLMRTLYIESCNVV